MFQKEVAERIVAAPGDEAYGRLAVLAGWRTEARILFDVPAAGLHAAAQGHLLGGAARPARAPRLPCACAALERVTAAAFGQRRKMLRQSLKSLGGDTAALIAAAGLDPTQRAETVPVVGVRRPGRGADTPGRHRLRATSA